MKATAIMGENLPLRKHHPRNGIAKIIQSPFVREPNVWKIAHMKSSRDLPMAASRQTNLWWKLAWQVESSLASKTARRDAKPY